MNLAPTAQDMPDMAIALIRDHRGRRQGPR
jgi:hypothetical protein